MLKSTRVAAVCAVVGAALAVACGAPTSGSPVVPSSQSAVQNGGFTTNSGGGGSSPSSIKFSGLVSNLNGTCPDLTFLANSVSIVANSATVYTDGGSCAAMTFAARIDVTGTFSGWTFVANSIRITKNKDTF